MGGRCPLLETEEMEDFQPLFKRVAVFIKPTRVILEPLARLHALLTAMGVEPVYEDRAWEGLGSPRTVAHLPREDLIRYGDIALVLGGDGSMLGVARRLAQDPKPIVGINTGRLGFITDVVVDDMGRVLPNIFAGGFDRDRRYLLEGTVSRNGRPVFKQLAVNDLGFSHGRAGGMVDFVVYVDGIPMSSQSADGIICSTTTGSTAYSLAAGGPILHPSLDGLVLVPVAPHTLSNRPIVLPSNLPIEIELTDARDAVAYFDMQEFFDVLPGDVLSIRRSDAYIEILHPKGFDYFELLRRKLKWNYMPKGDVPGTAQQ